MCRSIRTLRRTDGAATTGETEAAARQFVRKLSGYRTPSRANQDAFESAVAEISAAAERLLAALGTPVEEGPDPWNDPEYRRAILAARPAPRRRLDPASPRA